MELTAKDAVALAGWAFDNEYCWLCRFEKAQSSKVTTNFITVVRARAPHASLCRRQGSIAEARAYLDSAMVARLISESEEQRNSVEEYHLCWAWPAVKTFDFEGFRKAVAF